MRKPQRMELPAREYTAGGAKKFYRMKKTPLLNCIKSERS